MSEAIRRAVAAGDDVDLIDVLELLPAVRRDDWRQRILAAEHEPPSTFNPNGYAPVALQAAWSAITHPWTSGRHSGNRLTGSLVAAVHAGNDTDTVAAIAGAYLGARWGGSIVPEEWLAVHGWPGLDAGDLRSLAHRITG